MKQMRSRFRLITLLLACAFLLTLVLCTGSVLKATGISLSSLSSLPVIGGTATPDPSVLPDTSVSPDASPEGSPAPAPSEASPEALPEETGIPGTDNSPIPEYNLFGL